MLDTAERGDRKYLKVFDPEFLNENELKIRIIFE